MYIIVLGKNGDKVEFVLYCIYVSESFINRIIKIC